MNEEIDTPALPQLQPGQVQNEEQQKQAEQARALRLDALGEALAKKRSEAIEAREQSGIESQWLEDEEFYQGIDDANRNEHSNAWRTKPPGQYQVEVKGATRSTVFPNITRPYCDAGSARFADMVLPNDDRNWALRPTTLPDLVDLASGKVPPQIQASAAKAPDPALAQQQIADASKQAALQVAEAKRKADKAQSRIEDWQVESQYHAEVRKVLEDSSRIGSGVLKGPIPIKKKVVAFEGGAIIIQEKIQPASKRIDPWNFYPDGACGEYIHNGSYTWERDYLTPKQLMDLRGTPGYIDSQIKLCLDEGPQKAVAQVKREPDQNQEAKDNKRFEIWYFHGTADRDDMIAAGCECEEGDHPVIPAMVTMVNNRVIKAALNPLDSGDFPYDVMPWQRKSGMPWGNGIARQGRTPQRITTAATRNMMDNGGLSAGPQIVLKDGIITPADGQLSLTPRKFWRAGEDAEIDDVRKAMTFFEIPSMQKELMEIIQFGMKLMEDATGLPMLLQGQQGKAPDTVGGMTLLNNNASAVLRRLARTFDDCITEPHIRRYYTWLLQYGEDDEKGDFSIDARGSSALVERDLQAQQIAQLLSASANPIYGIDPKKTMTEHLKSLKFDPKSFEFEDDQWAKIVQNLSQMGQNPRLAVAQMKMQLDEKLAQMDQAFEAQENDKDRNLELVLAQVKERIEEIKQSGAKEISFAEMKTILAETVIKVRAERDLSQQGHVVDLHKHHTKELLKPPVEPVGRAPAGQSFAK